MLKSDKANFFIYNGQGSSSQSVEDNERLCRKVSGNADVRKLDFKSNLDGIDCSDNPIIVMPGGSSYEIAKAFKDSNLIQELNRMGWGYLGVCAGAYLACSRIQIFSCTYKQTMKDLKPVYVADNHGFGFGFRFGFGLTNCTAMGPFYPNDSCIGRVNQASISNTSYCTKISFNGSPVVPQLYVNGCGFMNLADSGISTLAHYNDRDDYSFYRRENKKNIPISEGPLAAVIKQVHTEQQGSVLLFGTHPEASVEESKLLEAFKPDSPADDCVPLSTADFRFFKENSEPALGKSLDAIRAAFSIK